MLWSRRWRLSVEMLQCHGMSLFCVWTLSMPMISIRACWRELWEQLLPMIILHCLTLSQVIKITHGLSLSVTLSCFVVLSTLPLWWHAGVEWSGYAVYQSRVLTCVLSRGSRVYVQACACPSDIWLCFNTVHEILFCGTSLAWINFVYICTLILFTV